MLISSLQNETTEENQRKLSFEIQTIREEIGEYLIKLIKHLIRPIYKQDFFIANMLL